MDSLFQSATTPRQNDLGIEPEPESKESPTTSPDDGGTGQAVNQNTAPTEPPQADSTPSAPSTPMAIQPEGEDLAELSTATNDNPSSSPEHTLGPATAGQDRSTGLLSRPAADAGMAIVRDEDPRQEFAACVRQKKYVDAMATVVSQLCYLEIVTIVEDENDAQATVAGYQDQGLPGHRMVTRIDLAGGDITTILGKRFIEDPNYKPIQDLHHKQVAEGLEIIKNNIGILKDAINTLKNLA